MAFSKVVRIFPDKSFDLAEVFAVIVEYQGACKVDLSLDDTLVETFTFANANAANNFITEQIQLTSFPAYGRIITLKAYDNAGAAGNVRKLDIERRNVICGSDNRNSLFSKFLPFNDFGKATQVKEFYKVAVTYRTQAAKTLLLDVYIDRKNTVAVTQLSLPTSTTESRVEFILATAGGAPVIGKNIAFKVSATNGTNHGGWVYAIEMDAAEGDVIPLVAGGG